MNNRIQSWQQGFAHAYSITMNDTSFLISLSGHKIYHRGSGIERAGGGKKDRDDRIILGPNVELLHSHNTPTLDEVLETIRGKKKNM